jgi:hypothetical protein
MKETDEAKLCLTCRPGAYYRADVPLYLLMVYAKARRDDLAPDAKRTVRALAARIKQAQRR